MSGSLGITYIWHSIFISSDFTIHQLSNPPNNLLQLLISLSVWSTLLSGTNKHGKKQLAQIPAPLHWLINGKVNRSKALISMHTYGLLNLSSQISWAKRAWNHTLPLTCIPRALCSLRELDYSPVYRLLQRNKEWERNKDRERVRYRMRVAERKDEGWKKKKTSVLFVYIDLWEFMPLRLIWAHDTFMALRKIKKKQKHPTPLPYLHLHTLVVHDSVVI